MSDKSDFGIYVKIALAVFGIVAAALARRRTKAAEDAGSHDRAGPADEYESMLARNGERGAAIKAYRARTGAGRLTAMAAIGAVEADEEPD